MDGLASYWEIPKALKVKIEQKHVYAIQNEKEI